MSLGAFAEGVVSTALPCSWALLAPSVLAVAAGRARIGVIGAVAAGVMTGMIVRAAGFASIPADPGVLAGLALGAAILVARRTGPLAPIGGMVAGLISAAIWQPCVGPDLAAILNSAVDRPLEAAIGMVPYALGAILVIPAAGFGLQLLPARARRRAAQVGAALGLTVALGVATGLAGPVVGTLVRWST